MDQPSVANHPREAIQPTQPLPTPSFPGRALKYVRAVLERFVLYFLVYFTIAFVTIGPCFWQWFEATHVDGDLWVARFYAPLLWLCDHCEPLSWLVNKYVNWWIL